MYQEKVHCAPFVQIDALTASLKEWNSPSSPVLAIAIRGAGGKVCITNVVVGCQPHEQHFVMRQQKTYLV